MTPRFWTRSVIGLCALALVGGGIAVAQDKDETPKPENAKKRVCVLVLEQGEQPTAEDCKDHLVFLDAFDGDRAAAFREAMKRFELTDERRAEIEQNVEEAMKRAETAFGDVSRRHRVFVENIETDQNRRSAALASAEKSLEQANAVIADLEARRAAGRLNAVELAALAEAQAKVAEAQIRLADAQERLGPRLDRVRVIAPNFGPDWREKDLDFRILPRKDAPKPPQAPDEDSAPPNQPL
ncbi:MAG TPA: hypothetical protein DCZ49_02105 [Hyphomonadaceae bacterium]|nr:hypothetical protein [Hyphomonadaceae bacterium]